MASTTITATSPSATAPSALKTGGTEHHNDYLRTSTSVVQDYSTTKLGGETDILSSQALSKVHFGDWRDEFFKNGYHVVKGAIPRERARAYREKALDWFGKFDFGFDINNKNTWVQEHLPMMMKGGVILNYCAAHENEPGVIEPFAQLWGTDELLVSFDSVNITLPGRTDVDGSPWPHVDQSPTRKGLACVQGIINLSPAGPRDGGLQLLQGSSELFDQFFVEHPPQPKADGMPGQVDWYGFSSEDVGWFEARGCKFVKVEAEPGDVIIWDSRSVHYAKLPESDTIRTVLYATYAPAKLATPEDLALKAELFKKYEGSTHWPHCNIWSQGKAMREGKVCPGERDEPLEKPELTETVLKLAGIKPY
ncbi:hypothetical protein DL769_002672 [Monosporascus sp. CRB-8-3]|nr:hypothetical protein DL769_002672 [Monosporascus sp. CRB-8-3]